ncbi:DUF4123 domain-containing protein [Zooshikella ganghwensis]|uniref:DUF4123 domain-containing protein n=1 Tax=Zooshikella ganghwensis TaxID=202772 RepID=A0A4P9VIB6_9GAMM|nr:DUF4123 domain-containing protein [Zooshikella ganghwensis]RDH42266.1 DUF4123 domain-containing protein [Zooshikella ganghwensis]
MSAFNSQLNKYFEKKQHQLYALIDGAIVDELMPTLFTLEDNPSVFPVFIDTPLNGCLHLSPCLVELKADSKIVNFILDETREAYWGLLLGSTLAFESLSMYLQSLLYVKTPLAEQLVFRYQDPRVINPLLNASTTNEQAKLLGPIDRLWVPNQYRPELFRQTSSTETHDVIKDEFEREWVVWQNPQAWHGQFPEERPWFEFSAKQWEGIMAEHKHKVEEAIALYLMEENPAFKKLKPKQLHETIRYWCDKSDDYGISKTKLVARLILVVTEFGPDIPKREWMKLEQEILFNTDFSEYEKLQHLEGYRYLMYEHPDYPFDPVRCLAYEEFYDGTDQAFNRQEIDLYSLEDMGDRQEFIELYLKYKQLAKKAFEAQSILYEQYQNDLVKNDTKTKIDYLSCQHWEYRKVFKSNFNKLA